MWKVQAQLKLTGVPGRSRRISLGDLVRLVEHDELTGVQVEDGATHVQKDVPKAGHLKAVLAGRSTCSGASPSRSGP